MPSAILRPRPGRQGSFRCIRRADEDPGAGGGGVTRPRGPCHPPLLPAACAYLRRSWGAGGGRGGRAVLLLQLLNLLQREEGAAAGGGLLGVAPPPLLEAAGVPAPHVQPQVLLVPRAEVAVLAGEGFGPCRHSRRCPWNHPPPQGTLLRPKDLSSWLTPSTPPPQHRGSTLCPCWWAGQKPARAPSALTAFFREPVQGHMTTHLSPDLLPTGSRESS